MRQFLMALAAACTVYVCAAVDIAIVRSGADLEVRVPAGLAEDGDGLTLVWDDHDQGESATGWAHQREIVPSLSASGGVFTTPVAELGTGLVYARALLTREVDLVDGTLALRNFAYVDTGARENEVVTLEAGFSLAGGKTCNWAPVMGASHDKFTVGCHNTSTSELYLRYNGEDKQRFGQLDNSRCNDFVLRNRTWTLNGVTVATGYTSDALYPSGNATIHLGTTAVVQNSADVDWYYFRVAGAGGQCLGNLVPARVGAAGTPCLYDSVKGRVVPVKGMGSATALGSATNTVSALAYVSGMQLLVHGEVPTLDVKRPRVGHPLTVEGLDSATNDPGLVCAWYRGTPKKVYDSVPFARGLAFSPVKADAEHWIRCVVTLEGCVCLEKEFYFSELPVCYLTTDDGASPSERKESHTGTLFVQGNDEWKSPYDGVATFNVRGNSTAKLEKKPYKVKLDEKTKMFGMPKSKHWVLLANYYDPSQLRNKLMYDLANEIGTLGMKSTWVQVVLNGKLKGIYQFCEHLRVASNRVPIYDWEDAAESAAEAIAQQQGWDKAECKALADQMTQDLGWVTSGRVSWKGQSFEVAAAWPEYVNDLSGGYLFEFSAEMDAVTQFTMPSGFLKMQTMVVSPEYLKTNTEMYNAAQSILQDYWDACTSSSRRNAKGQHYAELCDIESMTAYFLINELCYDFDGRYRSRFAYKDHGGKLVWGPVWDFDWSSRSITTSSAPVDEWACYALWRQYPNDTKYYSMFKEWASDWYFARKCREKYWAIRAQYSAMFETGGLIDQYADKLAAACAVDDTLWPRTRTAAQDVAILKDYLSQRRTWLDAQFATTESFLESMLNPDMQTHVYAYDPHAATPRLVDGEGRNVPPVPLEWLRTVAERVDPVLGYADAATLQVVVTNVPSAWGKTTPLWMDYVFGTDPNPTSTNAVFRITSILVNEDGSVSLEWFPDLGAERVYTVEGTKKLAPAIWHVPETDDRFFRVRVDLPGNLK